MSATITKAIPRGSILGLAQSEWERVVRVREAGGASGPREGLKAAGWRAELTTERVPGTHIHGSAGFGCSHKIYGERVGLSIRFRCMLGGGTEIRAILAAK